ncbi:MULTISPECIES: D-2-hydroxyacid dehydrogenase family protein [Vibrio]|uniref:D-2-hydroxyacid dehydrogenase family protein n=1 Tax=Vibrio TaxID=662 RepID=UPI0001B94A17|nr:MULTISPECIES: D-2-hydroxyacid dehydrogenase family protein [Vibrio]EEX33190.1 D-3-phosphoglycerate dehydrogenase [Vibrio coralliilyticus ATCC BAA-450]MDE3897270.1 D-2-hydroxyacid dehydrogenase family protein [Vibrio sp. CC007]NRF61950.1 D-2-hydroxyacid dehydrogenase family protein [Vibrio coralliilyticus]
MRIAILDDYQDQVRHLDCYKKLNDHDVTVFSDIPSNESQLIEQLQPFEVLVLIRERTIITPNLLKNLPNLKLISQTGKISNHLNLTDCDQHQVAVAEGIGSPIAPSELCWSLIMAASRHIPAYLERFKQGHWQQSGQPTLGRTLNGQTLGIWGFGKIGQRIAKYAEVFGMHVMVWGSESSRQNAIEMGYQAANSRETFFEQCDVISLHLRLNDATRHIISQKDLDAMKSDSLLVNISRAELIEPNALYQTLATAPTKQAAVDVFDYEPATKDNEPLLSLPNVIATPHLGYVEQGSYELYFQHAFDNILSFAKGDYSNITNAYILE